jgi:hypothetical protein
LSRLPITRILPVEDAHRTVAALVDSAVGPLIVYGTVLPWHTDPGPTGIAPGWAEHHRIVPMQAREWAALRERHPGVAMCVAGDFNMNLGGARYYGTAAGREALRTGLDVAGLSCLTETESIPPGVLAHGPIDHICLSDPLCAGARVVAAWEGTDGDGVRLSDHSGVVVEIDANILPVLRQPGLPTL